MDWEHNPASRIIFDNGSHTIKAGYGNSKTPQITMENLTAIHRKTGNVVLGDQIEEIFIENEYNYIKPLCRGVLVKFDNETQIWDEIFKNLSNFDSASTKNKENLFALTMHPFVPYKVKEKMMEIVFEYYGFGGFLPCLSQQMIRSYSLNELKKAIDPNFQLIVESGHSATYIAPFFNGEFMNYAAKKIDVGGKLLTNLLKENISFKYLDLSKDYRTVNDIKETMGLISLDFKADIKKRGKHTKHYVLPDPEIRAKGYATEEIDTKTFRGEKVTLDKERFTIPEVIFSPNDIGIYEAGLTDSILQSIGRLHPDFLEMMLQNIVVSGGNSLFPNFSKRLYNELKPNTPDYMEPCISTINDLNAVYTGCYHYLLNESVSELAIKKSLYEEKGSALTTFGLLVD